VSSKSGRPRPGAGRFRFPPIRGSFMRRLLSLVVVVGLMVSVGCKEEKVIPPKETPPPPSGPPIGASKGAPGGGGAGAGEKKQGKSAPQVSPD